MESEISTLTLRALRQVLRATEHGTRQLAAATGLTPSQLLVLREISMLRHTIPSLLAVRLQFSQATITNIVDRLSARGLVTRARSARDRRQSILEVTPAGAAILTDAPDSLQVIFRDRFAHLPQWEQAMILAAVDKLALLLDAQDIDAAPLLDSGRIDRPGTARERAGRESGREEKRRA